MLILYECVSQSSGRVGDVIVQPQTRSEPEIAEFA